MSTTAETSPTKSFAIRSATLADAGAIFGLLEQLGASFTPEHRAFDAAIRDALVRVDHHMLFVAESPDGVVVGYALATVARLFYTNGTAAQLQELVVDDGWRGHRVGTSLVTAVERYPSPS